MIGKEAFVMMINSILEQEEFEKEFTKDMEKYFEGHLVSEVSSKLISGVIEALKIEFDDTDETIEWWLYDAPDAGKSDSAAWIKYEGVVYPLKTPEQLYDWLVKMKEV